MNPIPQVDVDAKATRLVSPRDTKGWNTRKENHLEVFIAASGEEYVRAHPREIAEIIITSERYPGMPPTRLVRKADSSVMRRARRAARKAGKRTLAKRKAK